MECFQIIFVITTLSVVQLGCCQTCSNLDADVIIIGAGMSGIAAANRLQEDGTNNFIIFEAQPQVGGRVKSGEIGGVKVSLGATWIQGIDPAAPELHPLYQIVQRCGGLQGVYHDFDSQTDYDSQGGTNFTGAKTLRGDDFDAAFEEASVLATQLEQEEVCFNTSTRDGLTSSGWIPTTAEDKWIDWFGHDFCVGEAPEVSSLCDTLSSLDINYSRFASNTSEAGDYFVTDQEGYEKLIKCMATDLTEEQLHLNATVTEIDWSDNKCVCVTANENGNQNKYCARHAISTLSVGVLQSNETVRFSPELPPSKIQSIRKFAMARYVHIYMEFSEVFWDSTEQISHIHQNRGYYPLFFNLNSKFQENPKLLFVALTGADADRVSRQPQADTVAEIEQVLRNLYPGRNISSTKIIVPDWITNPLFLGSYSYAPVGRIPEDYADLASPVGNLYFSGEAISRDFSGFLHGAYFAGIDTAEEILKQNKAAIIQISSLVILFSLFCAFVGLF